MSEEDLEQVKIYGITPLGNSERCYEILADTNTEPKLFSSIYIDFNNAVTDSVMQIDVKTGTQLFSVSNIEIQGQLNRPNNHNSFFFLPERIQDDRSESAKIHSLLALRLAKCLPLLFGLSLLGLLLARHHKEWHFRFSQLVTQYGCKFHGCIYLLCVLGGCLFMLSFSYPDKIELTGDAADYQAMAVNLVYGHGFLVGGGLEDSSVYKCYENSKALGAHNWQSFYTGAGTFDFYRNPVYTLFIAGVYKLFSVSPAILFRVQFLLLILSGSLLPYISYRMVGIKGISAGVAAFAVFLVADSHYAFALYTEALIISYLLVFVLVHLVLDDKRKIVHAFVMGLLLGFGLLLKNCFMPLAGLYIVYLFCENLIRKTVPVRNAVTVVCGMVLIILPWTVYVNLQNTKTHSSPGIIFITTQGNDVLLGSNNEYSEDGGWHPEWLEKTESFYNQPEQKNYSVVTNMIRFYCHYPPFISKIFPAKIRSGLLVTFPQLFFYLSLGLLLLTRFMQYKKWDTKVASYTSFAVLFGLAASYLILPEIIWKLLNVFLNMLLKTPITIGLTVLSLVLTTFGFCISQIKKQQEGFVFLSLLLLNFLILTIIFYGSERIEGVVDFLFLLIAFQLLFQWLNVDEEKQDSSLSTPLQ